MAIIRNGVEYAKISDMFVISIFELERTLSKGDTTYASAYADVPEIDGYKAIGCIGIRHTNAYILSSRFHVLPATQELEYGVILLDESTSTSVNATLRFVLLYIRDDLYQA